MRYERIGRLRLATSKLEDVMNIMKFFALLLAVGMTLLACSHHNPYEPVQTGSMPLKMDLTPAIQHNLEVSRVAVTITKGDFSSSQDMTIAGTEASGLFGDLELGTYAIDVQVFEDLTLIATGQGTGTVAPGDTTTVFISLSFVSGGLEIVVDWGEPWASARRVLLVGNSHTYFNGGVDSHLQNLIDEARPGWNATIQSCTYGGYTLENHFNNPASISAITTGDWDLVILQEQSSRPMTDPALFYQYATALDSVIAATGSQTGFYMTWAWRNNPEMYEPIRDAYTYIAAYLDAMLAPAGFAFHLSGQVDPHVNLYAEDNYHPSLEGTYLVACLMLASIWDISPVGLQYIPAGLTPGTAQYLQTIAWQAAQQYNQAKQLKHPVPAPPLDPNRLQSALGKAA